MNGSASEVVHEGLRLVEEREAKLYVLRQTVSDAALAERSAELEGARLRRMSKARFLSAARADLVTLRHAGRDIGAEFADRPE